MTFSSTRIEGDYGFSEMTDKMVELAKQQDGFLRVESVRNELEITESYLLSIESGRKILNTQLREKKGKINGVKVLKQEFSKAERDYVFELNEEKPSG